MVLLSSFFIIILEEVFLVIDLEVDGIKITLLNWL